MRTLITGATGFIGGALAAQLTASAENDLAVLVRDSYRSRTLPEPLSKLTDRVLVVYADLQDYEATRSAIQAARPDIIFHLAAAGAADPFLPVEQALQQNLLTTLNLVRAAFEGQQDFQPQQFIVVRTPGELVAMNPYAASKAAAWQICLMYARTRQWPLVGAMPFQTYGPGQNTQRLIGGAVAAAVAGEDFALTAGAQERDWVYIDDVVGGLVATASAGLAPGTTVELGTGQLTSVADVVSMVYELAGGDGRPLIGEVASRAGEVQAQVADTATAAELVQWRAAVPLREGLQRTIELARRRSA